MTSKIDNPVQIGLEQRRRFLRLFGTAAVMLPVTAIVGCSDDTPSSANQPRASDQESPSRQNQPAGQEPSARPEAENGAAQSSGDMEKLSLDNPTAKSLGYKHDAANVDFQQYPQRAQPEASNHYCRNCALYPENADGEWGPCTLFPGKLVNANGWCSAYVARPA